MVCQAAGQTRFKALKHENGIAGRTTIIVRIIACFQPLQNCQVALVAQMSQQFLKLPDLDQMACAQLDQTYHLPYFNSSTLTTDVAFQGQINSDLRAGEFFKLPHPYGNISYPTENPYLKNSQNALPRSGLRVSDNKPIDASCAPQEKKFLIFDRSGNHTRLFFSQSFCPQNQVIASSTEKVNEQFLSNPLIEEKWDENDLSNGEGEMLEDSEEIDALLYSDSENDEYDDEDEDDDDEVTSTMHIPFGIEEGSPKRQRLLDGGYNKSSLVSSECPANRAGSCNYNGIDASEKDKKVKIRKTLKILESLIPGSKSDKDPVSVIEKAIAYLGSMRIEAEALGLTGPENKSADYP